MGSRGWPGSPVQVDLQHLDRRVSRRPRVRCSTRADCSCDRSNGPSPTTRRPLTSAARRWSHNGGVSAHQSNRSSSRSRLRARLLSCLLSRQVPPRQQHARRQKSRTPARAAKQSRSSSQSEPGPDRSRFAARSRSRPRPQLRLRRRRDARNVRQQCPTSVSMMTRPIVALRSAKGPPVRRSSTAARLSPFAP